MLMAILNRNSKIIVNFSVSEPLPPTGLNLTSMYHGMMVTTFTLEWDLPSNDEQPSSFVEYYTVTTIPPSRPGTIIVNSPPLNITLDHNILYNVRLAAVNCAGESESITILRFLVGK